MGETHSLLEKAERIWRAGLAGVEPQRLVAGSVKRQGNWLLIRDRPFDLAAYENIFLIAFGKAAPAMAEGLLEILGDRVRAGLVIVLPGQKVSLSKMKIIEAPHPWPDDRSCAAGREIIALARSAGVKDLVFFLLSGGGSAQVALPLPGLPLEDKKRITRELMLRSADIAEINVVRKHLSTVKGGRLAEAVFPAEGINLVISDVIGDDLEAIASGPSHWDSSTSADALAVLQKFELWETAPAPVKQAILDGLAGRIPESLKKGHEAFKRVSSFIIGNNAMALEAARREAEAAGFRTMVLTSSDGGEARAAAKAYTSLLAGLAGSWKKSGRPLCLISGGELTVCVKGDGQGGRNQEFVLAVLEEIAHRAEAGALRRGNWLVASLGTDGIDGNTDAAGAWAGPVISARAGELGLDIRSYLEANDSHRFFERTGGLIVTGPTGTNVMDLRIFLLSPL